MAKKRKCTSGARLSNTEDIHTTQWTRDQVIISPRDHIIKSKRSLIIDMPVNNIATIEDVNAAVAQAALQPGAIPLGLAELPQQMQALQQQLAQSQAQTQAQLLQLQNQMNLLREDVAVARREAAIANNGASLDPEHPLMVVRMGNNDPVEFPATVGELRQIGGPRLANLLAYYNILNHGTRLQKIKALGARIGARRII